MPALLRECARTSAPNEYESLVAKVTHASVILSVFQLEIVHQGRGNVTSGQFAHSFVFRGLVGGLHDDRLAVFLFQRNCSCCFGEFPCNV